MPRKPKSDTKSQNWIERNPHTSQFIVNSILVLLTLAALVTTAIFSNKGINESKKQYDLAFKQLTFAKSQHLIDSAVMAKKDINNEKKQKADSILAEKKYSVQEKRNINQDLINKKQADAIQLQANTAKKQYDAQVAANKVEVNNNKPIFMLQSSKYDTIKKKADFTIVNVGKREATVYNTVICSFNIEDLTFYRNYDNISKMELNDKTYLTQSVLISKAEYNKKNTLYYLSFHYLDGAYDTPRNFFKYFNLVIKEDKSVEWKDITDQEVDILKNRAKMNHLVLESR